MNKVRREELSRVVDLLDQARDLLETIRDEEQEAFDNLPESIQCSERGEAMENCISTMEEMLDYLDTGELQEIVDR